MYFLGLGIVLLLLKYQELGSVASWPWWLVLSPFGLAIVWWAWADWTGLTKAAVMRREEKRRLERIARAQAPTGQPPQAARPPGPPRR